MSTNAHTEHEPATAPEVHGLAVADGGLRVEVEQPELRRGREERISFRIVGSDGDAVRDFDVTHEKRMHLIVVRRDLTGFQHLHPELGTDGTWTTRARLAHAGSYRLFADFSYNGEATTLVTDLRVDGPANLRALPDPVTAAKSDGGYDVQFDGGTPKAGEESELRFLITRHGETIHTEPYLGAGGHLVALREGDLPRRGAATRRRRPAHPLIAGLAMAFSSVSVVANALRLRRFRSQHGGVEQRSAAAPTRKPLEVL